MHRLTTYFWPFAEYRDVNHGNLFERAAAFRHNRGLALALPAYINRWAMISAVLLILTQAASHRVAPLFGVLFTVSFCALSHVALVWTLFRRLS